MVVAQATKTAQVLTLPPRLSYPGFPHYLLEFEILTMISMVSNQLKVSNGDISNIDHGFNGFNGTAGFTHFYLSLKPLIFQYGQYLTFTCV